MSPGELKVLAALEMNKIKSVCHCFSIWSVWIIRWVPMMMTCRDIFLIYLLMFLELLEVVFKETENTFFCGVQFFLRACVTSYFLCSLPMLLLCSFASGLEDFTEKERDCWLNHTKVHTPTQCLLDCLVGTRAETNYLHIWESVQM